MSDNLGDVRGRVVEMFPDIAGLPKRGGGGTSGGVTDDWKASVEERLKELHDDVRNLLRAGVVAAIGLAGLVGGLYLHTDGKFDEVESDFKAVDQRMDRIEIQVQRIEGKIDTIGAKIDAIGNRPRNAAGS